MENKNFQPAEITSLFFKELKQYNGTNFKSLYEADLTEESPKVHKACSSVVTRYFIFKEKHPELSETELNILYYKLRIDLIARYFSEYPAANLEDLKPFQAELKRFVNEQKEKRFVENTEVEETAEEIEKSEIENTKIEISEIENTENIQTDEKESTACTLDATDKKICNF